MRTSDPRRARTKRAKHFWDGWNCEDPKKLREFVGSFVREITVNDSEVVVDYHPECLVRHNHRAKIHSAEKWLPILGSLRTVRLTLVRPARFTVGKQDVVLTLAA